MQRDGYVSCDQPMMLYKHNQNQNQNQNQKPQTYAKYIEENKAHEDA